MSFVVALGGVTCGGKTSLANILRDDTHNMSVSVVHQDDYYWPPDHEMWKMDGTDDWDVISAIDVDRLAADVLQLSNRIPASEFGTSVASAAQDYRGALRSPKEAQGFVIDDALRTTVVIVEGNMLYNSPKLDSLFDCRFFFTLSYELCKARRLYRSYVPPEPEGYFDNICWPRYTENLLAAQRRADIVMVDASLSIDAMKAEVGRRIENLMRNKRASGEELVV